MTILLRIIAVCIGIATIYTAWWAVWFWSSGRFAALIATGLLGIFTLIGWIATLVLGPFATVQLWRFHLSGLWAATALAGFAAVYYLLGVLLFRAPNAPLFPILLAGAVNLFFLGVLLSPRARATCRCARPN